MNKAGVNLCFLWLQLELITDLLGTPNVEDMSSACEAARKHMVRRPAKPPSLAALYTLSSQATHEAVHLLSQMLVFNPVNTSDPSPGSTHSGRLEPLPDALPATIQLLRHRCGLVIIISH